MKRIRPCVPESNVTPFCSAKVHLSSMPTWTRARREAAARRLGLPIEQCGRRSTHEIDGVPLCHSHAGMRAIQILMEREEESGE